MWAGCTLHKPRGQPQVATVEAPGFGDNLKSIPGDLAILIGGTVFVTELDIKPERPTTDLLGSTRNTTVTKQHNPVGGEYVKDTVQASSQSIRRASGGTAVTVVREKEDREVDTRSTLRVRL